ncbi:ExbD/TolR family protein [Verrucomicrobiota bacterium]
MAAIPKADEGTVSGLRMRYFPRSRVGHGMMVMAPWFDVIFLIIFFLLLGSRLAIQPGMMVDLPVAPFKSGSRSPLVAVVFSVKAGAPGRREEIVLFNDDRFVLDREGHRGRLRDALSDGHRRNAGAGLIVSADSLVRHGTIVELLNMAREEGITEVNIASRSASDAGP